MYDKAVLKNLRKLGTLAPAAWPAFQAFDKAAMADGAVPVKYKELIAVGVALTTQCIYCVEAHVSRARAAGASDAELARAEAARHEGGDEHHQHDQRHLDVIHDVEPAGA